MSKTSFKQSLYEAKWHLSQAGSKAIAAGVDPTTINVAVRVLQDSSFKVGYIRKVEKGMPTRLTGQKTKFRLFWSITNQHLILKEVGHHVRRKGESNYYEPAQFIIFNRIPSQDNNRVWAVEDDADLSVFKLGTGD